MFQTLIRPSSGASEYLLCCVGCNDRGFVSNIKMMHGPIRIIFTHTSNFIQIRPVGAELFHADGKTEKQDRKTDVQKDRHTTKLIVARRKFFESAQKMPI